MEFLLRRTLPLGNDRSGLRQAHPLTRRRRTTRYERNYRLRHLGLDKLRRRRRTPDLQIITIASVSGSTLITRDILFSPTPSPHVRAECNLRKCPVF